MQLVYIINSYKDPAQVVRLVRTLAIDGTGFAVHVDRKSDRSVHDEIRRGLAFLPEDRLRILPSVPIYWGGPGLIPVHVGGLARALEMLGPTGHAVFLTAQDYPIKPVAEIASFFAAHRDNSFILQFPMPYPAGRPQRETSNPYAWLDGGLFRYQAYWLGKRRQLRLPPAPGRHPRLERQLGRVYRRMHPEGRVLPHGMWPFGGSGVWALNRAAARHVVDAMDDRLTRWFFRTILIPDEMMIQTLIMNSHLADTVIDDDLHEITWDEERTHPTIITTGGVSALAASRHPFARKFDIRVDPGVFDEVDRVLL